MSLRRPSARRCPLCGSTRDVQANHVGGRHHIAWFSSPLCGEHHQRFHTLLRRAGVDLRYTNNKVERVRRVLAAVKVFEWMMLETLKQEEQSDDKSFRRVSSKKAKRRSAHERDLRHFSACSHRGYQRTAAKERSVRHTSVQVTIPNGQGTPWYLTV